MNAADEIIRITDSIHAFFSELDRKLNAEMKPWLTSFPVNPNLRSKVQQVHDHLCNQYIQEVTHFLDQSYASITELDQHLSPPEQRAVMMYHRSLIQPFFLQTRFVRRSVDKPLGYPGDYGIVEILFDAKDDGVSPLARILSRYTLNIGPARAHRSRLPWANDRLWQRVQEKSGRPLQILSFACGPEYILRQFVADGGPCEITLCDFDRRALEVCRHEFKKLTRKTSTSIPIHYVELSAFSLIKEPATAEQLRLPPEGRDYDVILVLGLLDYLTTDGVTKFLNALVPLLKYDGELLLTNLHVENPWRSLMEYIGDWNIRHRGVGEFRDLVVGSTQQVTPIELVTDETGTNLYFAGRKEIQSAGRADLLSSERVGADEYIYA